MYRRVGVIQSTVIKEDEGEDDMGGKISLRRGMRMAW